MPEQRQPFTPNTIVSRDGLIKNLEKIRRQGYAEDDEEFDLGVRCLAAPVIDFRGKVIGSIGISGPASRLTLPRMKEISLIVMEVGKELSERM